MMSESFFNRYKPMFGSINGMFDLDAALLMTAYAQLAADAGVRSDTLEIGVHHGLSALLVAALRADDGRFVAIDLFEALQDQNISHSGAGDRARFLSNMARLYGESPSFLRIIAAPSSSLSEKDLGRTYSFCHVDGGHSVEETYRDLLLCSTILMPGGLLVLDDYFNAGFPGVSEGAIRFALDHPDRLTPLAIGFNKVLFQACKTSTLNQAFQSRFALLPHTTTELWGKPVFYFGSHLSNNVDFERSTPHQLVTRDTRSMVVRLQPTIDRAVGKPNEVVTVPVRVDNKSDLTLSFSGSPIGLSYHLMSSRGEMLAHDNARQYFHRPLAPGDAGSFHVLVTCPQSPGEYQLEIDLVWEGVCWFKDKGNIAPVVPLLVI
jgi:predicted O-methyltransferase YrrM